MSKKNLILGGILAVLILLSYVYQGPLKEWRKDFGRPDNFLSQVNMEEIDKIEATSNGERLVIEKSGGRWKLGGTSMFYVKEEIAADIAESLKSAAEANFELVSENNANKEDFNTGNNGTRVKLMQGENILADFTIGRTSEDLSGTYISEAGSDETYAVAAGISNLFAKDRLYDRTIFNTEAEKITRIRFQYPTREFTVEREAIEGGGDENEAGLGDWSGTVPYSFSVDQEKIEGISSLMSNLQAAEIPEQSFENTGLEKNLIIVQAAGEGVDNTIMVGEENADGLYYAKRGDSDNIYLITEEQKDLLDQTINDLR